MDGQVGQSLWTLHKTCGIIIYRILDLGIYNQNYVNLSLKYRKLSKDSRTHSLHYPSQPHSLYYITRSTPAFPLNIKEGSKQQASIQEADD